MAGSVVLISYGQFTTDHDGGGTDHYNRHVNDYEIK
jgi:hypothetical protein